MPQLFLVNGDTTLIEQLKSHWESCGLNIKEDYLKIETYLHQDSQKIYHVMQNEVEDFIYQLPLHSLISIQNPKILDVILSKWTKKREQDYIGYKTETCHIDFKAFKINRNTFVEIGGDFKRCPPSLLEKMIPFHVTEIADVLVQTHKFKNSSIPKENHDKFLLWMHAIFEYEIQ
eukprot:NODE_2_length_91304_cov_0.692462.p58 type:complete len:175 gc:universal NODE_2_length_91304_cov_0.692462:58357-57833(-)